MLKIHKMLLALVVGLTITGCPASFGFVRVNHIPMTPKTASEIKNKEVVTTKREKPSFYAATAGKVAFAILGVGLVAIFRAGNEIVAKNNIDDPAIYIGEKLSADLSAQYGTIVSPKSVTLTDDDVQTISKSNSDMDLILDIRTIKWGFSYFPTTWNRYRAVYYSRLRLIDAKGGKVLAEGSCSRNDYTDVTPGAPSYDELLANNAERLKRELQEAADFCVGDFKTKVLQF